MQDRFRFRAWNKNDKRMIYNAEFAYDTMTMNNGLLIDRTQEYPVFQLDYFGEYLEYYPYYEVMQCTGLKDKNGKLIYEGDILEIVDELVPLHQSIQKIYWSEKRAGFCFRQIMCEGSLNPFIEEFSLHNMTHKVEVIGNIYENPELLEVQDADNE